MRLDFPLLGDWPEPVVGRAYDVFNEERHIHMRTTFVVDRDGVVRARIDDRDPSEHPKKGARRSARVAVACILLSHPFDPFRPSRPHGILVQRRRAGTRARAPGRPGVTGMVTRRWEAMRRPVIAISRQRGSGAEEVGAIIARKLDIPFYDRQVLDRAAAEAGVSETAMVDAERNQSLLSRMLESLGRYAGVGVEGTVPMDLSSLSLLYTSGDFRLVIEEVLRKIADAGSAVIVGHGACQVALRRRPDVLHVFLHASRETRVRRIMFLRGVGYEEAKRDVEQADKDRTGYYQNNFNINWYDLRLYDLVLKTGTRSFEQIADEIVTVAHQMPEPAPAGSRAG
jgi:cytidylate kinase